MREIFLSNGKLTQVNDIDFLVTLNFKYHFIKGNKTNYVGRNVKLAKNKWTRIYLHQDIIKRMGLIVPKDYQIDHEDRDGLNNQRYNLRIVSKGFQKINQHERSDNTSGQTGVYYNINRNTWYVEISLNNKRIYLGSYHNINDAIKVRQEAEIKYYGEIIQ